MTATIIHFPKRVTQRAALISSIRERDVALSVIVPKILGVVWERGANTLLSETAYGNIHTTQFPAGEIRGEIRRPGRSPQ